MAPNLYYFVPFCAPFFFSSKTDILTQMAQHRVGPGRQCLPPTAVVGHRTKSPMGSPAFDPRRHMGRAATNSAL